MRLLPGRPAFARDGSVVDFIAASSDLAVAIVVAPPKGAVVEKGVPQHASVLVIGGGPGGATAASFLSRAGFSVVVLERDEFPRYHIGESLLPSCLEIVDLIGARATVEAHGFKRKPGAYLEWGAERWSLDFGELRGRHGYSFQVERAVFDNLLLRHAQAQGAAVFERHEVTSLEISEGRPRAAEWRNAAAETGKMTFDYLIDASGRHGIISTKYLRNRRLHKVFQNVAAWGYWESVRCEEDGYRDGAIAVGSIPDGWLWSIPFSDGKTSIGVVMHKDKYNRLKADANLEKIYAGAIAECPLLTRITSRGRRVSDLWLEQDYSYAAESFSGPGYFMCGDAACFLDPLLSTGVHLAMLSAMLASASIASLLRKEVPEASALAFFEKSYRQAYLRFLVFVQSFYDQKRGKDSYFSEARDLSHYDTTGQALKQAFLNLVSGIEDLSDAEAVTAHLMGEMSRRVVENHGMRQDKDALRAAAGDFRERAEKSSRFFDAVEGLPSMTPEWAVDGWYVTLRPSLGLARVTDRRPEAA
jgi:flavin-dependent dehydrogenase